MDGRGFDIPEGSDLVVEAKRVKEPPTPMIEEKEETYEMMEDKSKDLFGGKRGARGPKKFCYTYADLARLYGVTEKYLMNMKSEGVFDPGDLEDVLRMYIERQKR